MKVSNLSLTMIEDKKLIVVSLPKSPKCQALIDRFSI